MSVYNIAEPCNCTVHLHCPRCKGADGVTGNDARMMCVDCGYEWATAVPAGATKPEPGKAESAQRLSSSVPGSLREPITQLIETCREKARGCMTYEGRDAFDYCADALAALLRDAAALPPKCPHQCRSCQLKEQQADSERAIRAHEAKLAGDVPASDLRARLLGKALLLDQIAALPASRTMEAESYCEIAQLLRDAAGDVPGETRPITTDEDVLTRMDGPAQIEAPQPAPTDEAEADIVRCAAILEGISNALDGDTISDFMLSFPLVRAVADLRHQRDDAITLRDEYKALAAVGTWHQDCRLNRHKAAEELQKSQAIINKLADRIAELEAGEPRRDQETTEETRNG